MIYHILEFALILIPLAGFTFVPDKVIPRPVWPLIAGVGFLTMTVIRSLRLRTFPDEAFGPGMAGVIFTTFGLVLFLDHQGYLPSLIIALGVGLLAGVGWAFWRASRAGN